MRTISQGRALRTLAVLVALASVIRDRVFGLKLLESGKALLRTASGMYNGALKVDCLESKMRRPGILPLVKTIGRSPGVFLWSFEKNWKEGLARLDFKI